MKPKKTTRRKFRVTYARIVIMEIVVEAASAEEVEDRGLPGVYDRQKQINFGPEHVRDIVDEEHIWKVEETR